MCRLSAEDIKALMIDWLIFKYPDVIIGNEIMYGSSRRMVDLLAIVDGQTIAFEIKSSSDNLSRLPEQINEYKRVFDKINIVASPSHLLGLRRIVTPSIGMFIIEDVIKELRTAKYNHRTVKKEMLYSMSSSYLKKRFPQYRNLYSDQLRQKLSLSEKKDTIHSIFIDYYITRITEKYKMFLNDRGDQTHIDDIPTLSSFTIIDQL